MAVRAAWTAAYCMPADLIINWPSLFAAKAALLMLPPLLSVLLQRLPDIFTHKVKPVAMPPA